MQETLTITLSNISWQAVIYILTFSIAFSHPNIYQQFLETSMFETKLHNIRFPRTIIWNIEQGSYRFTMEI